MLVYLKSIKSYFAADDEFNWNYGVANCATGKPELMGEAEEALLAIKSERYRGDYLYFAWLARALIANGKAKAAWELYTQHEGLDLFELLQLARRLWGGGRARFARRVGLGSGPRAAATAGWRVRRRRRRWRMTRTSAGWPAPGG